MESKPTKTLVHRVLGALKRTNRKVVTLEALSRLVGIYSDKLGDDLSYFNPLIRLDPSINCRDLKPQLEAYVAAPIKEPSAKKEAGEKGIRISKKELAQYPTIASFAYRKMTSVGGLVDTSARLSDEDLELLKRLVDREIASRRKAAKAKSKKK